MALANKIGVIVDSFRVGVSEGLKKSKAVGVQPCHGDRRRSGRSSTIY